MHRRDVIGAALAVPLVMVGRALGQPDDKVIDGTGWANGTNAPVNVNFFGRRDGADLVISATGHNNVGGYRTLLREERGSQPGEVAVRLINRPWRGAVTQALTPFYREVRLRNFLGDAPLPEPFLVVVIRVAKRSERMYIHIGA